MAVLYQILSRATSAVQEGVPSSGWERNVGASPKGSKVPQNAATERYTIFHEIYEECTAVLPTMETTRPKQNPSSCQADWYDVLGMYFVLLAACFMQVFRLAYCLALQMEEKCSSETSVYTAVYPRR